MLQYSSAKPDLLTVETSVLSRNNRNSKIIPITRKQESAFLKSILRVLTENRLIYMSKRNPVSAEKL